MSGAQFETPTDAENQAVDTLVAMLARMPEGRDIVVAHVEGPAVLIVARGRARADLCAIIAAAGGSLPPGAN